jgi:hypothetical protein
MEAEMVDANLRLCSNNLRRTNESGVLKSSKSAICVLSSQIKVIDDVSPHALVSNRLKSIPVCPKELINICQNSNAPRTKPTMNTAMNIPMTTFLIYF